MKIEKLFTEKNVAIMLEVEELLNKLELDEESAKELAFVWITQSHPFDMDRVKLALFVNHYLRDRKYVEIDLTQKLMTHIGGILSKRPAPVLRIPKLVEESNLDQDSLGEH